MRPKANPFQNRRIECGDGSLLYRMSRPRGRSGRVGISLRTKPGESRASIAYRLKRARKTLQGVRRAVG